MNNLWTPSDTRYLMSWGLSTLVITIFLFGSGLMFYHVDAKYDVSEHLVKRLSKNLGSAVQAVFKKQTNYVKQHFYDVARASEFYTNDLYGYFASLLGKAGAQERSLEIFTKFQVWLTEFFVMFVMCIIAVLGVFAAAY